METKDQPVKSTLLHFFNGSIIGGVCTALGFILFFPSPDIDGRKDGSNKKESTQEVGHLKEQVKGANQAHSQPYKSNKTGTILIFALAVPKTHTSHYSSGNSKANDTTKEIILKPVFGFIQVRNYASDESSGSDKAIIRKSDK